MTPSRRSGTTEDPSLERTWVFNAGIRKVAMAIYATLALALMAAFFKVVQRRWPGRGAAKGLVLGAWIGSVGHCGVSPRRSAMKNTSRSPISRS